MLGRHGRSVYPAAGRRTLWRHRWHAGASAGESPLHVTAHVVKEEHLMIGFIVAGLVIGFLARAILPGKQHIGLLWTLVLGVIGSVIGGTIANAIGSGDIMELNVIGFVCAVIAAILLLSIADRAQLGAGPRRGQLGRG
jgi:uncharacterized membrane protein YeaQ/YmgE (transglycosylase-associated protein family)